MQIFEKEDLNSEVATKAKTTAIRNINSRTRQISLREAYKPLINNF